MSEPLRMVSVGPTGSGKTVFVLAMHAILSSGYNGFFLAAPHDTSVRLADAWDLLLDAGELPHGTSNSDVYRFRLTAGVRSDSLLTEVEWFDFRGGVLSEDSDDYGELFQFLTWADTVCVLIDSRHLASGLPLQEIQRRTDLAKITAALINSAKDRPSPPNYVLVLSKADLLRGSELGMPDPDADPEGFLQAMDELVEERLEPLVGAVFADGTTTMICPVSLGDIGTPKEGEKIDPFLVNPQLYHHPILFSALDFLTLQRQSLTEASRQHEWRRQQAVGEKVKFEQRSTFMRRLLVNRGRSVEQSLTAADELLESLARDVGLTQHKIERIERQLWKTPIYIDGKRDVR